MTKTSYPLKVGLLGIGLPAYWEQFEGLKERLEGYIKIVEQKLLNFKTEVINIGLVDTNEKALLAGHRLRQEDAEIIFLYTTTYALSSTILPIAQLTKLPIIVLNLSAEPAIDYAAFNKIADRTKMTGEWLAYCSGCAVPEIANVFNRAGISFHQVTGMLHNDEVCWKEIKEWVEAARVCHAMFHNTLGAMGHYYGGMLDIYSDLTQQCIVFGGHIEIIEVDELSALKKNVTQAQTKEKVSEFYNVFDIEAGCPAEDISQAAKTAVALDKLVDKYQLGSLAYYYKGTGIKENEDTMSSIILGASSLTANKIPVAGEYEIKNVQAMKIMDSFDAGGSFTEYYAMDYVDDIILMGHDGPGHLGIAEGKIKVRPLQVYHGKVGKGLSVEMRVQIGPVTLLSVVSGKSNNLMLLCAEGETVPGPVLEIGNTNSRYKFSIGARNFVNAWNAHAPAHHWAVGVGHIADKIKKLGALLNMEVIKVC
ncbi:MAG: arabinose isomerase [Ginsengibacter sp.]